MSALSLLFAFVLGVTVTYLWAVRTVHREVPTAVIRRLWRRGRGRAPEPAGTPSLSEYRERRAASTAVRARVDDLWVDEPRRPRPTPARRPESRPNRVAHMPALQQTVPTLGAWSGLDAVDSEDEPSAPERAYEIGYEMDGLVAYAVPRHPRPEEDRAEPPADEANGRHAEDAEEVGGTPEATDCDDEPELIVPRSERVPGPGREPLLGRVEIGRVRTERRAPRPFDPNAEELPQAGATARGEGPLDDEPAGAECFDAPMPGIEPAPVDAASVEEPIGSARFDDLPIDLERERPRRPRPVGPARREVEVFDYARYEDHAG